MPKAIGRRLNVPGRCADMRRWRTVHNNARRAEQRRIKEATMGRDMPTASTNMAMVTK